MHQATVLFPFMEKSTVLCRLKEIGHFNVGENVTTTHIKLTTRTGKSSLKITGKKHTELPTKL